MSWVEAPVFRGFTEIAVLWENLPPLTMICGGYVRYMASPRKKPAPAGDIDIFPRVGGATDEVVNMFLDLGFEIRHENTNSVTFRGVSVKHCRENDIDPRWSYVPTLQVVKSVYSGAIQTVGPMEDVLGNFDFTVVRGGLVSPATALVDEDFTLDETAQRLRIKNIHCPVSSTLRAMKYGRKGYYLPPSQAFQLFLDWDARSPEYREEMTELFELEEMTPEQIDRLEALLRVD